MRSARNVRDFGVDKISEDLVPIALRRTPSSAVDLFALALEHRLWAERSTCPAEQVELHRVADIYQALASIEFSIATVAEVEGAVPKLSAWEPIVR
jgi:hypothetical protein